MTKQEFDNICKELDDIRNKEMGEKRKEYCQDDPDVLNNFFRTSKHVGVSMKQAWAVHANKHWDSIMTWVKGGEFGDEGANGRFGDLINYLYFGYAIYCRDVEWRKLDNKQKKIDANLKKQMFPIQEERK